MITILPCPFCGHEDVEINEIGVGEFAVDCPECQAIGPITDDIMSAIHDFNRRHQAPKPECVVSTTPAGRGEITPADEAATILLATSSSVAGPAVVEPPKLDETPAEARSDEIIFGRDDQTAVRLTIDNEGWISVYSGSDPILLLTPEDTAPLGLFMTAHRGILEGMA